MKRLVPGAEIAGYCLEEVLGEGGMGVVWRAKQVALERPVALKVLPEELAEDQEFRRRFEREAKLAARIRHPNIVIVHDARQESGVLVLAMELIRGKDLAALVEAQGRLDPRRILGIIEQLGGALDAAHAQDLVHRDVKPANVLIGEGEEDHVYLTDFGLTKALSESAKEGLTRRGTIVGTPDYMSPEQIKGEPVDTKADIYALGCVLFELLAGQPPYRRDTDVATFFAQVNDPIPSLREAVSELPAELDDVVAHAMAKAPEDRFPSGTELARAARAAIEGVPVSDVRQHRPVVGVDGAAWDGHTIIAGLGTSGSRLATGLDAAGYRVVVIELDGAGESLERCRERGIPVLVGDAADPDLLDKAQISRARHLIVTCGQDARNLDVAMMAEKQLQGDRPGVLTAFAHLSDLGLLRAMKLETVRGGEQRNFRLECFNAYASGARLLLDRHPPFEHADGAPAPSPHICVVGQGPVATNVILVMAAQWRHARRDQERLPLILAGPQAPEHVDELTSRWPQIGALVSFDARRAEISSAHIQSGEVLLDPDGQSRVTKAYVTVGDESEALAAALGLHGQPATESVPIVVGLDDDSGPAADVLRSRRRGFTQNIEAFGVLSSALSPTLLMRGVNELLARANHQVYLREQQARGAQPGASMVAWEDLPQSLRDSNRRFADGIGAELEAVGCTLVPDTLSDADGATVTFSDDEVEKLARREHDRWMADLMRDGWRFHEGEKDPEQKLHPLLVPWDELDEVERDKDRDAVRAMPQILARAGLEVIRRQSSGEQLASGVSVRPAW